MDTIHAAGRRFVIDRAAESDVPAIVALLADDVLGAQRESGDLGPYLEAFRRIDADPAHTLVAVRDDAAEVVATMQLIVLPGLSRSAATRLQIEAVRVSPAVAGRGLGSQLLEWAHEHGRRNGARLAQLTSDKSRSDAHRFYVRHGYRASHEGFKRPL